MGGSGLSPTQTWVKANKVNQFADLMANGEWDWDRTANTKMEPMLKDESGNIVAGHHRFVAAQQAGVQIPEGVVKPHAIMGGRVVSPWSSVVVRKK